MIEQKFKTGEHIIKEHQQSGSALSGFNCRVLGSSYNDTFNYPHERADMDRRGGWNLADGMISAGKLFYVHNFHQSHGGCPKGFAFPYGGTWVCNTCNNNKLDQPWWRVKVFMDGNAWCCIGEDFENLQESENFAFGDTRDAAISNYGDLFTTPTQSAT